MTSDASQPAQRGTSTVYPKLDWGGETYTASVRVPLGDTDQPSLKKREFTWADVERAMTGERRSGKRGNRRPSKFKQTDIERALNAAKKSGSNYALEIKPDGTIRLEPASETTVTQGPPSKNRIVL